MIAKAAAMLSLMLAIVLVPVSPAAAGECTFGICGGITHYAPDEGFDGAFLIRCNYGDPTSQRWVNEGENSNTKCRDTDQVYVAPGNQIVCLHLGRWLVRYDAAGWHKITDNEHPTCVHQRD